MPPRPVDRVPDWTVAVVSVSPEDRVAAEPSVRPDAEKSR